MLYQSRSILSVFPLLADGLAVNHHLIGRPTVSGRMGVWQTVICLLIFALTLWASAHIQKDNSVIDSRDANLPHRQQPCGIHLVRASLSSLGGANRPPTPAATPAASTSLAFRRPSPSRAPPLAHGGGRLARLPPRAAHPPPAADRQRGRPATRGAPPWRARVEVGARLPALKSAARGAAAAPVAAASPR